MKSIVVVDKNWGIGKDGQLLVHLPKDLKYFKEKTLGKVVVMGRTTFESLPDKKPLPGRINIVLSRDPDFKPECQVCRSEDELFEVLEEYDKDQVMLIGGGEIFKQFLPYCDGHLVTKIDECYDADRVYENLDLLEELELVYEGETQIDKGIEFKYTEYRRKDGEGREDTGK